ncbi:probable WRKY transcription factor 72 isoform X2 [Ipomoea triloba]|uniref:probable WRKY transcription factor 72 isoform X2 n=1 Tax=Ipomoea triloba TaxID=35885 RepID=UPI00125D890F|nr:probable WRKY transcription factor 72 isoform X2 [Ipomoea triloba]
MADSLDISGDGAAKQKAGDSLAGRQEGFMTTAVLKDSGRAAATVKAEMKEVKEENARLKTLLAKIEKDYSSLQMRFFDVFSHQPPEIEKKSCKISSPLSSHHHDEETQISLRLGRSPSPDRRQSRVSDDINAAAAAKSTDEDDDEHNQTLKLGLDYGGDNKSTEPNLELSSGRQSPDNSASETKEEDAAAAGETWPPSKALKATRSGDDELSQPSVKRARVSVRARCDTPTMNDGCQWRKYGQKVAKGNPCPRAYYRCTVAPSCPVRKQVQRCADDMSVLITTYEGTHNHPLPVAATAMASTTSAAASMLLSGSTTSQTAGLRSPPSPATNFFPGLNFSLPADTSRTTRPLYFPNSSSPPFPTITLDLTTSSNNVSSMFSSNVMKSTHRFPSTNLNFSSSESNISPAIWSTGGYTNYSTIYNRNNNNILGTSQPGKTSQEQQFYGQAAAAASQQALTETLTKAITSDPSLRSVIAAAITSMVGNNAPMQHKRVKVNDEVMGTHQAIS